MTLRDRTSEFTAILDITRTKKNPLSPPLNPLSIPLLKSDSSGNLNSNGTIMKRRTQFALIAQQIGQDIAQTADKLERLTKLAKRRGLFDDPSYEIQELTSVINQDIKNINSQLSVLQQQKSTMTGNTGFRKNKQIEVHSDTVMDALKSKLRDATKDFSQVLELRTESLKTQQKERENLVGSYSPFQSRAVESPLYKPSTAYMSGTLDGSIPSGSGTSGEVAIAMPQMQIVQRQDKHMLERADAVKNIEKTITELQQIFVHLASLVAEQGELVERIDKNVSETEHNVSGAQNQLLLHLSNLKSNKWLTVKIFGVLIFFVILFFIFFV